MYTVTTSPSFHTVPLPLTNHMHLGPFSILKDQDLNLPKTSSSHLNLANATFTTRPPERRFFQTHT